jgi:hypothetical protein
VIARRILRGNPPQVIHSAKHATGYTDHQIKSNRPQLELQPSRVRLRRPQGAPSLQVSIGHRPSSIEQADALAQASDGPPFASAGGAQSSRGTHPHTPDATSRYQSLPVACRQEFSSLDHQQISTADIAAIGTRPCLAFMYCVVARSPC